MMGERRGDYSQSFIRILCRILYSHVDHGESEDEAGNEENPCRDEHVHESVGSHMGHGQ